MITGTVAQVTEHEAGVRVDDGSILVGLRSNANPRVTFAQGSQVVLSVRPEAFRLQNVECEANCLCGKVSMAEFTGSSVNYLVQTKSGLIKAMVVNAGTAVARRGAQITLSVAKNDIFFVE